MHNDTFFFQALVYLTAAVVSVPIAKRIGLGSVLGYLIAGVIIGPTVLGLIGTEGQDIMHFAEFGVVMMLFVIGLELEPSLLWRMRNSIVGLGGLQVSLTSLVIFIISIALGISWQAALALGMTLSLSSTAIVLQTMNEKGLMKSASGQSSFSVLLFQDIAVIPMLAIFPLLATQVVQSGEDHHTLVGSLPGWAQTLVVLGAVALIIVGGRFLIRPVFRFIAQTRMLEIFTAASLLLVISIAVLMTQVGLSPALGTFLAGVVLANSEYRHELISDIEPFKGLLLGLFFISVGASINFQLIIDSPLLIASLVVLLMTIKGLVLFISGKFFRISTDQNLIFSVALSQVGEFAFVLFSFAAQNSIIDSNIINVMVAVVALSMAMTPIVIVLNEKLILPRFGTKEKDERESDTVDEENPVIIAGFDRFGNTVGRLLKANGIGTTVLDFDSDRVDVLRKLGLKVYYGDASRHELLHAAGAEKAKIIIVAFEDPEKNLALVHTVQKHFPHLKIVVRAVDRGDANKLINSGINDVYRETVDTSLRLGIDVMRLLGVRAHRAHRAAQTFLKHDENALRDLAKLHKDRKEYLNAAREYIAELEEIIRADKAEPDLERDAGWDAESLREDVLTGQFKVYKSD
ncbi:MAG: monovalent cation:proton antiporter-2 (CPA2) family protein [Ignavibacteriaceae bacterium]|nr:monovalent cation:proton antiporter-2 (CPA2) family protein [Ignavibacteriaceae bacterium]MCU0414780.1 monovalent cation:proton antiporter-2 (CPA2) family protein [Ignavibacteriaceae bacterium]